MPQPEVAYADEIETVGINVNLAGAGASAPTRKNNRNKYTVTRQALGVIRVSFNDDPGPTYQGIAGFCFGDPTVANVAGWSIVDTGGYTPRSGATPAFCQFTICNGANAVADLPATSNLTVSFEFKQAAVAE